MSWEGPDPRRDEDDPHFFSSVEGTSTAGDAQVPSDPATEEKQHG